MTGQILSAVAEDGVLYDGRHVCFIRGSLSCTARRSACAAIQRVVVLRVGVVWSTRLVEYVTSIDGTRIAYEQIGFGQPVVLVVGALSTAESARPLAEAFSAVGLRGVIWDRRGRGSSGVTAPFEPEREVEDLRAVVDAVGGDAVLLGHSAGAVLALLAAGSGVSMAHLFVSEPVLRLGEDEPPADLADRLQALVDEGRPAAAVTMFQRENVRLPESLIEQLHGSPDFAAMVPLAQTTVYDTRLIASVSTPTPAMLGIKIPTTVLRGEPAAPVLARACELLAAAMHAELVVVPESSDHAVDPAGTARAVLARLD